MQVKPLISLLYSFAVEAMSNSELYKGVDLGSQGRCVRYRSERETTQSKVKVPNSWLSATSKDVLVLRQRGG